MKKTLLLGLAFMGVSAYWILDAYAHALTYGTSLIDEIFLRSSYTSFFIKILIAFLIFGIAFLPLLREKPTQKRTSLTQSETFEGLAFLSEILFSSLSSKVNILKSLEKLEEMFALQSVVLFLYTKDTLTIYNENSFIKSIFRSKEIFPFRTNTTPSDIERIASTCFLEKRLSSEDRIVVDGENYNTYSFAIPEERSTKLLGNVMLITTDKSALVPLPMMQRYCEMLSFILTLQAKKENLEKLNTQFSHENGSYDKILNIMNTITFQEAIEHEYKRHKRYHTEVTLVLIEMHMFKNLTSVFPAELVMSLKKDFIALIRTNTREVDVFGKWTNDQFALLLPNVDFRAGQTLAKKIQGLLEEHKFPRIGKIACNFGITSLSHKDTIGTFRTRAESALALANSREGSCVEVKLLL